MVDAITTIGSYFGESRAGGTIINGDLTEFGEQGDALEDYRSIWDKGLGMNVYPGLGNHDYFANVVDKCHENGCAIGMINYFRNQVSNLNPSSFDFLESTGYEFPHACLYLDGSFGYSWTIGDVLFIQLNNYSSYEKSFGGYRVDEARWWKVTVQKSHTWIEGQLEAARKAGKSVVLNMHSAGTPARAPN
ncbi:hypothetical protein [Sorangium sp. So ce145]|uniref:hypothetical protein n=1 Tax=Sorangium sp. So ce145 TaxID=3133285 RepID=UPI003F626D25